MHIWFWAWVLVAVVIAVVAGLARDRHSAPWAAGAAAAASLEALGVALGWQWTAFLGVSSILYVAINRKRYFGRHARGRVAAPEPQADARPRRSARR